MPNKGQGGKEYKGSREENEGNKEWTGKTYNDLGCSWHKEYKL